MGGPRRGVDVRRTEGREREYERPHRAEGQEHPGESAFARTHRAGEGAPVDRSRDVADYHEAADAHSFYSKKFSADHKLKPSITSRRFLKKSKSSEYDHANVGDTSNTGNYGKISKKEARHNKKSPPEKQSPGKSSSAKETHYEERMRLSEDFVEDYLIEIGNDPKASRCEVTVEPDRNNNGLYNRVTIYVAQAQGQKATLDRIVMKNESPFKPIIEGNRATVVIKKGPGKFVLVDVVVDPTRLTLRQEVDPQTGNKYEAALSGHEINTMNYGASSSGAFRFMEPFMQLPGVLEFAAGTGRVIVGATQTVKGLISAAESRTRLVSEMRNRAESRGMKFEEVATNFDGKGALYRVTQWIGPSGHRHQIQFYIRVDEKPLYSLEHLKADGRNRQIQDVIDWLDGRDLAKLSLKEQTDLRHYLVTQKSWDVRDLELLMGRDEIEIIKKESPALLHAE